MGRKSHSQALSLWANGQRVGTWRIPTRGPMELQYSEAWMRSDLGRQLSLSLPFGVDATPLRGARVQNYFDNLLPDSEHIRRRIAARFKTDSLEPFDLLKAIGRDCVGALQLLGEDETPQRIDIIEGEAIGDDEIEKLLVQTVNTPGPGPHADDDDFRISLAGAQEKNALLRHEGKWMRPRGATPTTHILKLPLGLVGNRQVDLSTSVENEWLCLNILRAYGLPVAECEIRTFGLQKVLSVTRFDRQLHPSGAWYLRLPQEDFCQATGCSPLEKYEADGGPGLVELTTLLKQSTRPGDDLATLFRSQVLFWMLAATDGHAKNFSLHLQARGLFRLAPLYDVISTLPAMGAGPNQFNWHKAKLAMAVSGKNRHYFLKDIQRRHFNATARKCFGVDAEPIIGDILATTPAVVDEMYASLPAGFPPQVGERILEGLREAAKRLEAMPPA
ncbi:type II toxin-antitoxin system HipA family toxin [Variovorax sp. M-6]|uniref:type II toxin-antitoxin system HipA family toxin n=1 Tax=Variovorax sp. M-6 TaxID=3233041 RepID=UPI003F978EFC